MGGIMLNEIKAQVLNLDTCKEIFDLWYELSFLKFLLSETLNVDPLIAKKFSDPRIFDRAREKAQCFMKDKFKIDLEFENPKDSQ
jgi:hypothetical protein